MGSIRGRGKDLIAQNFRLKIAEGGTAIFSDLKVADFPGPLWGTSKFECTTFKMHSIRADQHFSAHYFDK